jgi:hypothetical protein
VYPCLCRPGLTCVGMPFVHSIISEMIINEELMVSIHFIIFTSLSVYLLRCDLVCVSLSLSPWVWNVQIFLSSTPSSARWSSMRSSWLALTWLYMLSVLLQLCKSVPLWVKGSDMFFQGILISSTIQIWW